MHKHIDTDVVRVVMAMARSTSGLLATAVVKVTIATATDTQTVFTRCQSVVQRRTVMYHGTQKRAHRLLPARTVAVLELSGRL